MASGAASARTLLATGILLAAVGLGALAARPAAACGALVFEEHEERQGGMSDQEVVMVMGEAETIVVVSAGYVDSSDEFAFLLPLQMAPTDVVDGDARLFYALEQGTAPVVTVIDETVAVDDGGGGCGCGTLGDAGAAGPPSQDVVVVQRGKTSTYDFVVVGGESGSSVSQWLDGEGFAVPSDFQAGIDRYIDDGWLFLAARIRPEATSGELAPVQLHFPAAPVQEMIFPIAISAYSLKAGSDLSITLYLIADMTVTPLNYDVAEIDAAALDATSATTSNYAEVFANQTAAADDGLFVLETRVDWGSPSELSLWLAEAEAAGRVPDDLPAGDTSLTELEAQLTEAFGSQLPITRLRTRLTATKLRDVTFSASNGFTEVYSLYTVYWDGSGPSTESQDTSAGFFLLVGLGWALRRRRTAESAGVTAESAGA